MYLYVFNYQTIEILEIEYEGVKNARDLLAEYNLDIDNCWFMHSKYKLNIENINNYIEIDSNTEYEIGTRLSTENGNCIVEIDKSNNCKGCIFDNDNLIICEYKCDKKHRQDNQSIIFKKI